MSRSVRILLADDSAVERHILGKVVRELGYGVIELSDAKDIFDTAAAEQPTLIVLDVVMGPPNGFEVCRKLVSEEQTSHIPVVFSSSKGTDVDQAWAQRLGAVGYLCKPIDPKRAKDFIARQVERALSRSQK